MGDFKPTAEQDNATDAAASGATFVVDACAGSGKTTTARAMCSVIDGHVLYLVYNKSAADSAKKTFPSNVKVSTTSALALSKYPEYRDRMIPGAPRVRLQDTAAMAGMTKPIGLGRNVAMNPTTIASWALETIQKYCYSADVTIQERHVPELAAGLSALQEDVLREKIVFYARKIWTEAIKPDSDHRFTFDYAFKLMVLSPPNLGYDTVIIDEAQDSNGATLHLMKAQIDSQLIAIGDPAQAIYGWRGATNIMDQFGGERLPLSKSFRFGQRIAEEANKWLEHTGTSIRVTGNENMDSSVSDHPIDDPDAILCRGNATVMKNAIEQMNAGRTVSIVGGTQALRSLAFAAEDLMQGKRTNHPELAAFADWGEVISFTTEPGGGDLKALVHLINEHKVAGILNACNRLVPDTQQEARYQRREFQEPDVRVSTVHKSKGSEWMRVEMADDFQEPDDIENPITLETAPGPIGKNEAMLYYVGVTRARQELNRGGLWWIDRHNPAATTKNFT